jgi:hypothetical protein
MALKIIAIEVQSRSRSTLNNQSMAVRYGEILEFLAKKDLIKYHIVSEKEILGFATLSWADYIITSKYISNELIESLISAKKSGVKIIYDVDDFVDTTKLQLHFAKFSNHNFGERAHDLKKIFELADVITVPDEKVKCNLLKLHKNIYILINGVNFDNYSKALNKPKIFNSNKIVILNTDNIKLEKNRGEFVSALFFFSQNYPHFTIDYIGDPFIEISQLNNLNFIDRMPYKHLIKHLSQVEYDFALVPLGGDEEEEKTAEINSFKNPHKFIHYSAAMIPGIYSKSPIYSPLIAENITGILTDNSLIGWLNSINKLVNNHELRGEIAKNAFEYCKANFDIKRESLKFLSFLRL